MLSRGNAKLVSDFVNLAIERYPSNGRSVRINNIRKIAVILVELLKIITIKATTLRISHFFFHRLARHWLRIPHDCQ